MALPPSYILTTEPIVGENCPRYPDTKNRVGKALVAAFLQEHTATGAHTANMMQVYPVTYTGNGLLKTVSLSDASAVVSAVFIWSEDFPSVYFATANMPLITDPSDPLYPHQLYLKGLGFEVDRHLTGRIDCSTAGKISVGDALNTADERINKSGTNYFALVLASGSWATPTNTDPPTWVDHGEQAIGDAGSGSGVANRVEKHIYDNLYTPEHNDDGTHKTAVFQEYLKLEYGTFTPTGAAAQDVTLTNTDLDVKALLFWHSTQSVSYLQLEGVTDLRRFDNHELTGSPITLGTGKFTIDGTTLDLEETVFELLSDTTDGSTTFTDTGWVGNAIVKTGTVTHSTDKPHTGATSIKFPNAADSLSISSTGLDLPAFYGDFDITFAVNTTASSGVIHLPLIAMYSPIPDSTSDQALYIYIKTSNVVYVKLTVGLSTTYEITGTTTINNDAWHTITVKRVSGVVSLEVDSGAEGTPFTYADPFEWMYRFDFGNTLLSDYGTVYLDDIVIKRTNPILPETRHLYLALGY